MVSPKVGKYRHPYMKVLFRMYYIFYNLKSKAIGYNRYLRHKQNIIVNFGHQQLRVIKIDLILFLDNKFRDIKVFVISNELTISLFRNASFIILIVSL